VFHGRAERDSSERLLQFFRACDAAASKRLREETAPLLLACVEHYSPLYSRVNSYPHLEEITIAGNPAASGDDRLYAGARPVLDRLRLERKRRASDRYRGGKATGTASHQLSDVLEAATQGRTASVFVPRGKQLMGRWEPATARVELKASAEGACDLLDLVAAETFLHGGEVLAVAPDEIPDRGVVAAVYRY
jgi:hypothetical protein